ncbi:MAG: hypothetical protein JWL61_1082 [Gemmatimonadetes bacterium]|nr:hypothetical protein [Gemmatimonadota bacterium]
MMLHVGFILLTATLGALFIVAVWISAPRESALRWTTIAAVLTAAWIGVTGAAAARGLVHFSPPPTMPLLIIASLVLAIGLALSPVGGRIARGIPLAALVGYQGFRVIVELLLHRAYTDGLMPVQMSFSGRNFDIITGVTALALGAWLASGHRSAKLVAAWNVLGILLLANVLAIAMLSAPTPFRVFMNEPSNVWITHAPWVWLPTVMVVAAIFGHVVVFRALASAKR